MSSILDNIYTYTYKYATSKLLPTRLVLISKTPITTTYETFKYKDTDYYFTDVITYFYDLKESYPDLFTILSNLRLYNDSILPSDILHAYVVNRLEYFNGKGYNLDNLQDFLISINNNPQVIEELQHFLNFVNNFLTQMDLPPWTDIPQLLENSIRYDNQTEEKYLQDKAYTEIIISAQDKLAPILQEKTNFVNGTLISDSNDLLYNTDIKYYQGLDIFNDLQVSAYVPYVRYNDEYNNSYFRIYEGNDLVVENGNEEVPLDHRKLMPNLEDTTQANTMYLLLFLGEDDESVNNSSKDYLQVVTFDLKNNKIKVRVPVKSTRPNINKHATERLQKCLISLDIKEPQKTSISAHFNLWGWQFDKTTLIHAILNYNVMQMYFYLEEHLHPIALKKTLSAKYHSFNVQGNRQDLEIALHNATTSVESEEDVNGTIYKIPQGTPYVRISISEALSFDVINNFIEIFPYLALYYQKIKSDIVSIFDKYLPNLINKILVLTLKGEGNERKDEETKREKTFIEYNSEMLRRYAPDLFVTNYKRRCHAKWLPSIILPEEIDNFTKQNPGRDYIAYPPVPNPSFYLTCLVPGREFINIKYNNTLINKKTHPYIFCCHSSSRKNDREFIQLRNDYLSGNNNPHLNIVKAEGILSVQSILPPGGLALLPYNFTEFLNLYSDKEQYLRYGVIVSPSSLLHAILTAVQEPTYLSLNFEEQENYAITLRQGIIEKLQLTLLKQECYDQEMHSLFKYLHDTSNPLDPLKHYHIFEEAFGINIFIAGLSEIGNRKTGQEHKNSTGQHVLHEAIIQIPNSYQYHHRTKKYRPTIIVYRNFGSESDALEYLQCELISSLNRTNNNVQLLFPPEFGNYCYEQEQKYQQLINWLPVNSESIFPYRQFKQLDAVHDWEIWAAEKQLTLISQYLDSYGKLRVLVFHFNNQYHGSIIVQPGQPLNLPLIEAADLPVLSDQVAQQIFGMPNESGYYKLFDMPNSYYIITDKWENIYYNKRITPSQRLSNMKRTLSLFKQTLLWLYMNCSLSVDDFIKQYTETYTGKIVDSAQTYNFSTVPRILLAQQTISVEEKIKLLQDTSNLIFNGKLLFYSPLFARQCKDYLAQYISVHKQIKLDNYYNEYYYTINDYKKQYRSQIFVNVTELNTWLDKVLLKQHKKSNPRILKESISMYYSILYYPYFFNDVNSNRKFLIQNVLQGNIQRAVNVSKNWLSSAINIGFEAEDLQISENVEYVIYTLSPIGTLVVTKSKIGTSTPIEILCYGDAYSLLHDKTLNYAAMLPLI